MTLSKSALTISSLAMAMLFGGGVYIMMNINVMAKIYVERQASQTLGVKVTLGELDITMQDRAAYVKNLVIGNPEGFSEPYAMKIPEINIVLGGVTKELVQFKDVDVSGAVVNLEVRENITNLQAIKNRIGKMPVNQGSEVVNEAMKAIIDKLTLSQVQLRPVTVLFTEEELQPVIVPDIVLTEIGRKENGVLADEAIAQVWARVAHELNGAALQNGLLEGMSAQALEEMGFSPFQQFKENLREKINENVGEIFKD